MTSAELKAVAAFRKSQARTLQRIEEGRALFAEPVVVAGIDTGQHLGVVFLLIDRMPEAQAPLRRQVRWVASRVVHQVTRETLTRVENDALTQAKVAEALRPHGPRLVVLEDPIDARPTWQRAKAGRTPDERFNLLRAKGEDRRGEGGETRFRQGVLYMAAVTAAAEVGARLASYPVRGRKGEPGWQSRRTREQILLATRHDVRNWGGPSDLEDHELMALGVLTYHLRQTLGLLLWP